MRDIAWHHFRYRFGEMIGLDRTKKEVWIAATHDEEGRQITPPRAFRYDTLVIAVGSVTNDFGTPGAAPFRRTRMHQCSPSLVIGEIDLGAIFNKHAHAFDRTISGRDHQAGLALIILEIDVGLMLKNQLHDSCSVYVGE
jgi:hypothetical protein